MTNKGLDPVLTFSGGIFSVKEGKIGRCIDVNIEKTYFIALPTAKA